VVDEKFFASANPVAEQQMSAAKAVASYWYTAWLRAGCPQL